jgi:hypothetical protein
MCEKSGIFFNTSNFFGGKTLKAIIESISKSEERNQNTE